MNVYFVTLVKGEYDTTLEVQAWNETLAKQEALQIQGPSWKVKAVERAHAIRHD